ncbi:hypothetical protein M569_09904 [Genlisea aurea]|uniref:DUF7054 domain-containing protein n=1 Tax=Genlisea aurea TaxID=192259 RepID=S8CDF7_9LAMI|nr:hypothetical protein M569_09904 [Genlisea aurea]
MKEKGEERKRTTLTEEEEKTRVRISDKALLSIPCPKKKVEEDSGASRRFLIVVNVFGSSGPLRFLVNGDDAVETVIDKTLRRYAHEGRLPALGFDSSDFHLYPSDAVFKSKCFHVF